MSGSSIWMAVAETTLEPGKFTSSKVEDPWTRCTGAWAVCLNDGMGDGMGDGMLQRSTRRIAGYFNPAFLLSAPHLPTALESSNDA